MVLALLVVATRDPAPACAAPFAYIANAGDNTVSVIDTKSDAVTATIDGFIEPTAAAVSPSGSTVLVTNYMGFDGNGSLSVVDARSNSIVAKIPLLNQPIAVAFDASGLRAYVVEFGPFSHGKPNDVVVVDVGSRAVVDSIPVVTGAEDVAIDPHTRRAYVSGFRGVSVLDLAMEQIGTTLAPRPFRPDMLLSFIGLDVNSREPCLYVVDPSGGLLVMDTSIGAPVARIPLRGGPVYVAVDPDGRFAYVPNFLEGCDDNDCSRPGTISVISTTTNTLVDTVSAPPRPLAVAVHPDGSRVYVTHNTGPGLVSVIDTASRQVVATIPVGDGPIGNGKFIGPICGFCDDGEVCDQTTERCTRSPTPIRIADRCLGKRRPIPLLRISPR